MAHTHRWFRVGAVVLGTLIVSGTSSSDVFARVAREGTEFRVTPITGYNHGTPDIAAFKDKSFVVVWAAFVVESRTVDVFGQRFDTSGAAVGSTFVVNTPVLDPESDDVSPAVSAIGDTQLVVAWTNAVEDGNEEGVFARVLELSPSPSPVTPDLQVNTYTTGCQYLQSVASTPDGGFIVTWVDSGELGLGNHKVAVQRFDAGGGRLGSEFEASETSAQFESSVPKIATRSDGSFVVTWSSTYGQDGSGAAIVARLFASDGTPMGSQFLVNTQTLGNQYLSDVAIQADDGFLLVWTDVSPGGTEPLIKGQQFASTGDKLGTEFAISQYTSSLGLAAEVDISDDGSFVVVWRNDGQDGDSYGVIGRRFSSTGKPDGTEFVVNTYTTGNQGRLSSRDSFNVVTLSDTSFVVVWDSVGDLREGSAVALQRFCVLANDASGCGDAACPPAGVSAGIAASDALAVLRVAVELESCVLCACDTNGSQAITATDALLVLKKATGLPVELMCPPC